METEINFNCDGNCEKALAIAIRCGSMTYEEAMERCEINGYSMDELDLELAHLEGYNCEGYDD